MARLAFVVVTDRAETIDEVVRALERQTVADEVELVVVAPGGEAPRAAERFRGRAGARGVPVRTVAPLAAALARGIEAAEAELVFLGETHAYPRPDCLERVLEAFAEPRVGAVVPRFENANPSALSWANFLYAYHPFAAARGTLAGAELPLHDVCVRRELLLAAGTELPRVLELGSGVAALVAAAGAGTAYEPRARVRHVNARRLRATVVERYLASRVFAAARARRWPRARRLAYALAWPLIAPVVAGRVLRSSAWRASAPERPAGTLAAVLLNAAVGALGEAAGYALGAGAAPRRVARYELQRLRVA
jgi:hypothetical protein